MVGFFGSLEMFPLGGVEISHGRADSEVGSQTACLALSTVRESEVGSLCQRKERTLTLTEKTRKVQTHPLH